MKGINRYKTRWAESLPACVWGHPPSVICSMAIACCQRHPQAANRGRQLQPGHGEVLRYNLVLGEVVFWKCQCRAQSVSALQRAALPGTAELALNELLAREGHNFKHRWSPADLKLAGVQSYTLSPVCTQTMGQVCSLFTTASVLGADWHIPQLPACLQISLQNNQGHCRDCCGPAPSHSRQRCAPFPLFGCCKSYWAFHQDGWFLALLPQKSELLQLESTECSCL